MNEYLQKGRDLVEYVVLSIGSLGVVGLYAPRGELAELEVTLGFVPDTSELQEFFIILVHILNAKCQVKIHEGEGADVNFNRGLIKVKLQNA